MSEKMIYAMSTKGSLGIDQFNEIFRMIYLPGNVDIEEPFDINLRRYFIRLLDSLGYCEFDFNRRMVHMCPPGLALLPSHGLPRAVLTGMRSPRLVKNLKISVRKRQEKALLSFLSQGNRVINMPSSICIEAADNQILQEIADELKIDFYKEGSASWRLANFSSSIDELKRSLTFEKRDEPGWKRRVFMKNMLFFSRNTGKGEEGQALVEYTNPVDKQLRHWLWNGAESAEVERDWGRYLSLADSGLNILLYDRKLCRMAVPITVPLPCILARALVMCTWTAPILARTPLKRLGDVPPGCHVQIYPGVTSAIASLVSEKLGQKLILISFKMIKW
jgi:hypothetical protein